MLLIKVEEKCFVFIYRTEQLNPKNISYWHYFTTKIMSICSIWNFTLYVTQSLHFFENHPHAIHMTTSVTRRLHILCIMLKHRAFFITSLLVLYNIIARTVIWKGWYYKLKRKHLHDDIILQRVEAWAHKIRQLSLMCLPGKWEVTSCNNVAPVSVELQSGPIRHNGAKNKLQLKHKNSLFTLQTFHYNYYWWSQSLLNRFGREMYAFQR